MRGDPIELEIFKNLYHSIAEEMGAALRRTAFSPNIKERRDYSCAVFDGGGEVIAMGDHMPVHLGSMPRSVEAAIRRFELGAGDMVMLNDPFAGGTHLPDITLVAPVWVGRGKRRASSGTGRDVSGVNGTVPGDLPGRVPDPARETHARRRDRSRRAGAAAGERAHAGRA